MELFRKKKKIIGYTSGVYDLFHVGHLNILENAKSLCDKLIVGVTTDELVKEYKGKTTVIPFSERIRIVKSMKYVDGVVPQNSMDKMDMWKRVKFDIMFVGDDWYETSKWELLEEEFQKMDVKIVYFPYTKTTSSTIINSIIIERISKNEKD
jgi:glycerol-3-phosphate cytidylyltransferase